MGHFVRINDRQLRADASSPKQPHPGKSLGVVTSAIKRSKQSLDALHAQADLAGFEVDIEDLDLDVLTNLERLFRALDWFFIHL